MKHLRFIHTTNYKWYRDVTVLMAFMFVLGLALIQIVDFDTKPAMPLELTKPPVSHTAIDQVGVRLVKSFDTVPPASISVDFSFLNHLSLFQRELLLRHLMTSAEWYVWGDHGNVLAFRRAIKAGMWVNPINGIVSGMTEGSRSTHYQFRICLRNTVLPQDITETSSTIVVDGALKNCKLQGVIGRLQQGYESTLLIREDQFEIEIFEQSANPERPLTAVAVDELSREIKDVLNSTIAKLRGFDPSLMPPESIKRGKPEIGLTLDPELDNLYHLSAYFNPHERGRVYFKIVTLAGVGEVSILPLERNTGERIGWSNDVNEEFICGTDLRFGAILGSRRKILLQAWFSPDAGGPDRKLAERTFDVNLAED